MGIFDNDRSTMFVSESDNSENRRIEISFKESVFVDKLVIFASSTHRKGFIYFGEFFYSHLLN